MLQRLQNRDICAFEKMATCWLQWRGCGRVRCSGRCRVDRGSVDHLEVVRPELAPRCGEGANGVDVDRPSPFVGIVIAAYGASAAVHRGGSLKTIDAHATALSKKMRTRD